MTNPEQPVAVTQDAKDAAENAFVELGGGFRCHLEILEQAFARAITAAEQAQRERDARIAEDRAPVVQCMSVEPVVAACSDIAAAIRKGDEA